MAKYQPLFTPSDPNILIFDKLDSTSFEAKRLVQNGAGEHGTIIWAQEANSRTWKI